MCSPVVRITGPHFHMTQAVAKAYLVSTNQGTHSFQEGHLMFQTMVSFGESWRGRFATIIPIGCSSGGIPSRTPTNRYGVYLNIRDIM